MLESRGQLTWGWEGGTEWGHLLLVEGVLAEKTFVCLSNHCGRQMFGRYNCQSILGPTSNRGGDREKSTILSSNHITIRSNLDTMYRLASEQILAVRKSCTCREENFGHRGKDGAEVDRLPGV